MTGVNLLSFRFLVQRPGRSLLTAAAVAVGVAVFTATVVMGAGQSYVRRWPADAYGPGSLTVMTDGKTGSREIARISRHEAIDEAAGEIIPFTHGLGQSWSLTGPQPYSAINYIGADLESTFVKSGYPVSKGRHPRARREVALSAGLARARGFVLGGTIELPLPKKQATFRIVGLLDDLEVGDILSPRPAVFTLESLADDFDQHTFDRIAVATRPGARAPARTAIMKTLGPTASVRVRPDGPVIERVEAGNERFLTGSAVLLVACLLIYNAFLISVNQRQRQLGILRAVGASGAKLRRVILGEGLILGVTGSVFGVFLGLVVAWLMGKLKAPLVGDAAVFTVPLFVPPLAVFFGTVVTVAAALPASRRTNKVKPIDAVFPERRQAPGWFELRGHRLGLPLAAVGLIGVFFLGLTGDSTPIGVPAGMGGMVLFLLGLIFCSAKMTPHLVALAARVCQTILGGFGRLAVFSAVKNPARTGVTVSTFFISVAVMLGFLTINNSIASGMAETQAAGLANLISVRADIADTNVAAITDRLADITEIVTTTVETNATLRFRSYDFKRLSSGEWIEPEVRERLIPPEIQITGVDPKTYLRLKPLRLVSGQLLRLQDMGGPNIYVTRELAAKYGLKKDEQIELIDVPVPFWVRARENAREMKYFKTYFKLAKRDRRVLRLRVAGILQDQVGVNIEKAFLDRRLLRGIAPVLGGGIWLKPKDGADIKSVARSVEAALAGGSGVQVTTREGLIERLAPGEMMIFSILGFVGMTMLLGVMSVANTQSAGISERRRELGLLKAVGLTNRKLKRMIMVESTALGLIGAVPGVIAALLLSAIFIGGFRGQAGPTTIIPYKFPYAAAVLVVAVTATSGLIAGFLTAGKVTEESITESMRYE